MSTGQGIVLEIFMCLCRYVLGGSIVSTGQGTVLIDLQPEDPEYISVEEQMQGTIGEHKGNEGGQFSSYHIVKVNKHLVYSLATNCFMW